jgi:hypothetical protein
MCHSDEDDELWNTDPQEYIRIKYGKHRNNYYYYEKKVKEGWSLIPQPNNNHLSPQISCEIQVQANLKTNSYNNILKIDNDDCGPIINLIILFCVCGGNLSILGNIQVNVFKTNLETADKILYMYIKFYFGTNCLFHRRP